MSLAKAIQEALGNEYKIEVKVGGKDMSELNITYETSVDGTLWRWIMTKQGMRLNVLFNGCWFAVIGAHPPVKHLKITKTWVTGGNVELTYENGKTSIERFGAEKRSVRRRKQQKRRYKREDNRHRQQRFYLN